MKSAANNAAARGVTMGALLLWLTALPTVAHAQAEPAEPVAAAEPASPPPSPEAVERAVAAYAHEPTVDDVVTWTLQASTTNPAAASDAIDRARLSGLLPQLRIGVRRGLGWDWAARQTTSTDTSSLASGEDLSLVGTLVFRLDRLLAPSEETGLIRERRALEDSRAELAARAIAIYFERRRLQVEVALTGSTDLEMRFRIEELGALLDLLTGGAFGAAMATP